MKQIKIIILLFIVFSQVIYSQCSFNDLIEKVLIEDIDNNYINEYIDLGRALNHKKNNFLGYIGDKKKRLEVVFTSIAQNKIDLNCYHVEGYTTVNKKNHRKFKGDFNTLESYIFNEPMAFEEEASNNFGFSILNFKIAEHRKESATGIFEGKLIILWKRDKDKAEYNNIFGGYDGSRNYQFIGTWTSYKTGKSSPVAWGQYRIPCAGDLDIGAAEFSPNPKYYKYGWADYKP
jgi:hypothetical protein